MIAAGFIYLGSGDRTRTYCCDQYFQNWSETDDPSEAHVRRAPTCEHVQEIRESYSEQKRAESFIDWPLRKPHRDEMIKAGFMYLGIEDKARTYCCQLTVQNWNPIADPAVLHQVRSPACEQALLIMKRREERKNETFDLVSNDLKERMIPGPPRDIRYNSYHSRFLSFSSWPAAVKISIKLMARAGFYYEGKVDFVKCFHCNGGAMQWENEEDPFRRHARMYPGCEYILYVKGLTFVEQAGSATQVIAKQALSKKNPDLICRICLSAIAVVCFVPCFHLGVCNSCARRSEKCPFCREKVTGILPVNLE
jgi:hypothetical protein